MSKTTEFWQGQGGVEYTARNRVDWRKRVKFWTEILEITGARSFYEVGVNSGWNLDAISYAADWDVAVAGEDLNMDALVQAAAAGNNVGLPEVMDEEEDKRAFDLAFTAGALIHQAPDELEAMMQRVIDWSADWVLAIEYADPAIRNIHYQGQDGLCWARPYGKMYQDMGLKMVAEGGAGDGFDDCHFWLMRR